MENKSTNINFLKKVWYSITKFEQYPVMAIEGLKKAIKYLIIITAIVTIFVTIGETLKMKTVVKSLAEYVQNNIPEFSYSNGNISMKNQETMIIKDVENIGIDQIVINTHTQTNEEKSQIEKENSINGTMLFLFKDEIELKVQTEKGEEITQKYSYNDFITNYMGKDIEQFNKLDFVNYLTSEKMINFYVKYATSMFIYMLIVNSIIVLLDSLEIALLGWITATIARIKIKFVAIYNMSVYSLTLPMILNILYIVINYFTNFTITYFQVAYITIAYIYLAAAIFILKDDLIKRMQEVQKIKQEQIKVREEIKEEQEKKDSKDEKKDNEDKKDKENEKKDDEPQGSEA